MATETQQNDRRDLHADQAICSDVIERSPYHWFVMHGTDVVSEDPPGSCELDSIAWSSAPIVAEFIAEARTGWPHAIERAINAEEAADRLTHEIVDLDESREYWRARAFDAEKERERLRAGIAVAMTYPPGIINAKLRNLLTGVSTDV
ncbi:hypothetical protein [Paenibacillus graminis]|uniref:hypothetical protein n=1 Tax=Paenibacillus graminis TaxID=189425 RepID=UPI002DBDDEED|nr:hypothetical protein [Paenibacillus graminis]MEC0167918.1 hypothetical protein [Paenibacillus graminis]